MVNGRSFASARVLARGTVPDTGDGPLTLPTVTLPKNGCYSYTDVLTGRTYTAPARIPHGQPANTVYGPVQIQLVVKSHKIVKVAVLEQPTNTIHDIQIGEFAFPKLIGETLAAQNAKIDAVSGASYTSAGYIASLQSAVDHGL